jgi:hypothetical protein
MQQKNQNKNLDLLNTVEQSFKNMYLFGDQTQKTQQTNDPTEIIIIKRPKRLNKQKSGLNVIEICENFGVFTPTEDY